MDAARAREALISDAHARDNIIDAELALDTDGKFLGLRVKIRSFGNLGAYRAVRRAMPPVVNIGTLVGVYTTPALHVDVTGMLTNTHAMRALSRRRPAGSLLRDRAADRHRRRRTEHRPGRAAPPQHHPAGGDALQDAAHLHLRQRASSRRTSTARSTLADWAGFEQRRAEAAQARQAARHRHLQHHRAGRRARLRDAPRSASIRSAGMTLVTGSISTARATRPSFKQMLVDRLGVDPQRGAASSRATPTRSPSAWAPAARARPP